MQWEINFHSTQLQQRFGEVPPAVAVNSFHFFSGFYSSILHPTTVRPNTLTVGLMKLPRHMPCPPRHNNNAIDNMNIPLCHHFSNKLIQTMFYFR